MEEMYQGQDCIVVLVGGSVRRSIMRGLGTFGRTRWVAVHRRRGAPNRRVEMLYMLYMLRAIAPC